MGRREAREAAMALVYSLEYHRDDIKYQIDEFISDENISKMNSDDIKYITEIAEGAMEKLEEIDSLISKYTRGWSFSRISGIDIAVLRLCIYEMFYRADIPLNVSINEAVALAKKYGHDDSSSFVNGILGTIYKESVKDGSLKESK